MKIYKHTLKYTAQSIIQITIMLIINLSPLHAILRIYSTFRRSYLLLSYVCHYRYFSISWCISVQQCEGLLVLSVSRSVFLSVSPNVCIYVRMSVCCMSVRMSVFMYVCRCVVCQSECLYLCTYVGMLSVCKSELIN